MTPIATSASWFGRRRAAALAAVLLALALEGRAAAKRGELVVIMLPATGRGVSTLYVEQARWLLVQRLSGRAGFRVLDYNAPPTAYPLTPAQAGDVAARSGAALAVAFDLSHENGRTTFDLMCRQAVTGDPLCHVREATSAGPDALPELAGWLAMQLEHQLQAPAVTHAPPPVVVRDLGRPGPATPPRERILTFGARAQMMVPVASAGTDAEVLAGIGLLAALDAGYVMASAGADLAVGNDNHMRDLSLGVFAPLASDGLVPFVGLVGLLVDQQLGGRGASGAQLRPTLGLLWGRHDVAKMRVELGYFVDLFEEKGMDRLSPGSADGHVAHGVALSAGATF
jgi:hypothetical protein